MDGRSVVLFLKRNHVAYRKDVLQSLLVHRELLSSAEAEARCMAELDALGLDTPPCVAVGARMSGLNESFSYIITAAAPGIALDDWLRQDPPEEQVQSVSRELSRRLKDVHARGIGLPTLIARHIFIRFVDGAPKLCMIDVSRLSRSPFQRHSVRDLARLYVSIPLRSMSPSRRLRFLRDYCGQRDRRLRRAVSRRVTYLLRNRRRQADAFFRDMPKAARREFDIERSTMLRSLRAALANPFAGIMAAGGLCLVWFAHYLAERHLLDDALELTDAFELVEDFTPSLSLSDWFFSPISMIGALLVVFSIVISTWMSRRN